MEDRRDEWEGVEQITELIAFSYARRSILVLRPFVLFSIFFATLSHCFVVQGAELAAQEGKSASALAACRTLAEELTEMRFPAPRILAFKVASSCFLENAIDFSHGISIFSLGI